MTRDTYARKALGVLHNDIKQSRVLMVGAGGIGCELLKNLVLTGFGEIHIVDLDTIDLSNLNRQFLFRHEHIKKSKALVAKATASKFNPNVKLEAHHANIKDPKFNEEWFKSFKIVFNALDNLEARRHVNRMCLLADVPLIESGTTGFDGQVQIIKKGKTECYDCTAKPVPKSFPVCTIRSTPSQPIHCIVWAKSYLFTELFNLSEDENEGMDHSEDSENAVEIKKLHEEAQALKRIRGSMGTDEFAQLIFEKVYDSDIKRLVSMEEMWKSRKPPTPLSFPETSEEAKNLEASVSKQDQRLWSLAENYTVFSDSLSRLSKRLKELQSDAGKDDVQPVLSFDKDDEDTLDFVAAAANLRSVVFGIETKSKFDIKQMAGNIIPAIATTNAMTAGLCVLQAFKVMRDQLAKARMIFLERSTARVINTDVLRPPNPSCSVCSVTQSQLVVDPDRATLKDLVDGVLRLKLGYGEELSVRSDAGLLYDPDFDDNLDKKLTDLQIKGDSFITVVDEEEENPRVDLSLSVTERKLPDEDKPVMIPEGLDIARKAKPEAPAETNGISNGIPIRSNGDSTKRKRSVEDGVADQQATKKRQTNSFVGSSDDGLVVVEDSGDGSILID